MDEQQFLNRKQTPSKARIETQIHRRRKAKAFSPLQAEWDSSQPTPPSQLRMPRGKFGTIQKRDESSQ